MYFSAADVRGQQIYYSNVSNLAFCQRFFLKNTEADNFIFTNSKILQGPNIFPNKKQKLHIREMYFTVYQTCLHH